MLNSNIEMLNAIYKNVKMGAESIHAILPKTSSNTLASDLTQQMEGYQKYASTAADRLKELHQVPPDNPLTSKLSVNAGILANTFLDDSPSHIAEIVMQGSHMGIVEMTKRLHQLESCDDSLKLMGKDIIHFEEKNIETLKQYL